MPYMVKIAQLMIPQPPWGRKYHYFCDPSSRFRDTAVFNFKWSISIDWLLIGP